MVIFMVFCFKLSCENEDGPENYNLDPRTFFGFFYSANASVAVQEIVVVASFEAKICIQAPKTAELAKVSESTLQSASLSPYSQVDSMIASPALQSPAMTVNEAWMSVGGST